jgi:hypothetical protein
MWSNRCSRSSVATGTSPSTTTDRLVVDIARQGLGKQGGGGGSDLRRLGDNSIARRYGGGDRKQHQLHRIVPGCNDERDAERLGTT